MAARAGRGFVLRPTRPLLRRLPAVPAYGLYPLEVLADSPLMYWRLGEQAGTVAMDSSGHVRNGTYVNSGSITFGVPGYLSGDSNTAVSFASADSVEIAHDTWMDTSNFTLELFVQCTSLSGNRMIASMYSGNNTSSRFNIYTNNATDIAARLVSGTTGTDFATVGAGIVINTPYHFAITYDGALVKMFTNGVERSSTSYSSVINAGTLKMEFANGLYNDLLGRLDEIAYYGTALSPARIAAHYAASQPPPSYRHKPQRAWRGIAAQQNGRW